MVFAGNKIPLDEEGREKISDLGTQKLLTLVLMELKIMNKHLQSITDEKITEEDIKD